MTRHNNFDLLRLLAASGVMALHMRHLSAEPALAFLRILDAGLSLSTFFVISGFLVYMSCDRTPSLKDYASKRLRRIVPAYVAVVLLCALLGSLFSTWPAARYFSSDLWRYLVANLSFLNFLKPDLPGVFTGNPFAGAPVNGALWTIKVELMFYALVPMLVAMARRFGHHAVLLGGFLFGCLWWGGFTHLATETGRAAFAELAKQMPGQLMFFLPGAWCYCERERLLRWGSRVGWWGLTGLLVSAVLPVEWGWLGNCISALGLSALVFWAALIAPYAGHVTRYGDFSYGIYLWHFPVIQALVQLGVYRTSPLLGLLTTVLTVLVLAWLSWHLIEARALRAFSWAAGRSGGAQGSESAA